MLLAIETADLDQIPFLDAHKITGNLHVILFESPILYSYIMIIHLTRIHHSGVDTTIQAVSNKMFVPEKLGSIVKDGLLQVQDHTKKDIRDENG